MELPTSQSISSDGPPSRTCSLSTYVFPIFPPTRFRLSLHGNTFNLYQYRLAHCNPFPYPVLDALAAYHHLLVDKDIPPERIIIIGDSAGGHLALTYVTRAALDVASLS